MSDKDNRGFFSNPTRRVGGNAVGATRKHGAAEVPPVPDDDGAADVPAGNTSGNTGVRTRRAGPGGTGGRPEEQRDTNVATEPEFVVGWLVVIDGPGRGASRPLGYGVNPLGRDHESGVLLDFGDHQISRCAHCRVVFDHKNRKFYIQHGGGQNLTYVGAEPVLSSCELTDRATISIGSTTLLFIQLVDEQFQWEAAE